MPELQDRIRSLIRTGMDLPEIEDELITPSALDEEQRAALWLYAWSLVDANEPDAGTSRPRRFVRSRWSGSRTPA